MSRQCQEIGRECILDCGNTTCKFSEGDRLLHTHDTFDGWTARGYRVHKGEKSKVRDHRGALFSEEQVYELFAMGDPDDEESRQLDADWEAARL